MLVVLSCADVTLSLMVSDIRSTQLLQKHMYRQIDRLGLVWKEHHFQSSYTITLYFIDFEEEEGNGRGAFGAMGQHF